MAIVCGLRRALIVVALVGITACGNERPAATPATPSTPAVAEPAGAEPAAPKPAAKPTGPAVQCAGDSFMLPKAPVKAGELEWDHQFWCLESPSTGTYALAWKVTYSDRNNGPLTLDKVSLEKVTPRPLARAWEDKLGDQDASFTVRETLPITLKPGESATLHIDGQHVLEKDDEKDMRANLHYEVFATGHNVAQTSLRFSVHMLSAKEAELDGTGPPSHRGGAADGPDDRGGRGRNKNRNR
ncbi:MAG: hypothetical protein ACI9MR_000345 [Myxococcota bacterium]|jgi:hypothetical protein